MAIGDFQAVQRAFTAGLRTPGMSATPGGVTPRQMDIYAGLVDRNLDALLRGAFPLLHAVLPPSRWIFCIRRFLSDYRAQTPVFPRLPLEFLNFLSHHPALELPGFARELAHYEWLEVEVAFHPAEVSDEVVDAQADPFRHRPIANPLARLVRYAYPVHELDAFNPTVAPAPTAFVIYRALDDRVSRLMLTPVTARLLELIQKNTAGQSGERLLLQLAIEMAHPSPSTLCAQGQRILAMLSSHAVLLGARLNARDEPPSAARETRLG